MRLPVQMTMVVHLDLTVIRWTQPNKTQDDSIPSNPSQHFFFLLLLSSSPEWERDGRTLTSKEKRQRCNCEPPGWRMRPSMGRHISVDWLLGNTVHPSWEKMEMQWAHCFSGGEVLGNRTTELARYHLARWWTLSCEGVSPWGCAWLTQVLQGTCTTTASATTGFEMVACGMQHAVTSSTIWQPGCSSVLCWLGFSCRMYIDLNRRDSWIWAIACLWSSAYR
jgi:hypothetical protein